MQSDLIWLVTQKDFDIPEKIFFLTLNYIMHRCNLTPVSNVSEAALISLFWVSSKCNELPENAFQVSLQPDRQVDNGIFNSPILARTQILLRRWRPRTKILVLFHRRT